MKTHEENTKDLIELIEQGEESDFAIEPGESFHTDNWPLANSNFYYGDEYKIPKDYLDDERDSIYSEDQFWQYNIEELYDIVECETESMR